MIRQIMDTKKRDAQFLEKLSEIANGPVRWPERVYDIKHFTTQGYDYAREAADLNTEHQNDHSEYLREQGITASEHDASTHPHQTSTQKSR